MSRELLEQLEAASAKDENGLLPCPKHHKGQVKLLRFSRDANFVHCEDCGFAATGYPTRDEAIAAWNQRSPSLPALVEYVKGLEREIARLKGEEK